jgi:hypothetical protein
MTNGPDPAPQRLQFSPAELAALYEVQIGDALPGGDNWLADLQVSAAQVERARQGLLRRKVLLRTPDGLDVRLSPAIERTFNTVLRPAALAVVQLTGKDRPAQTVCLSWDAGGAVLNTIEPSGLHVLEPLASPQAVAAALLRQCGLDNSANPPAGASAAASQAAVDVQAVVAQATLRALLLLVTNPSRPSEAAEALSWLYSGGQLWLLARRGEAGAALAPIGAADLTQLLAGLAAQCAAAAAMPV